MVEMAMCAPKKSASCQMGWRCRYAHNEAEVDLVRFTKVLVQTPTVIRVRGEKRQEPSSGSGLAPPPMNKKKSARRCASHATHSNRLGL